MALQFRRGTAADVTSNSFTPAIGEPLYVTDEQQLYIGDGATQKGIAVGGVSDLNGLSSVELISESIGTISSYSVTSNVVTVTLALAKGYSVGLIVTISGTTVSALNNVHTITAIPAANQFSFALTTPDVANTSISGTVTPEIPDGDVLYYDYVAGNWENHTLGLDDLSDVNLTIAAVSGNLLKHNGTEFIAGDVDIVEDTTPQLGGNLDTNNNSIVSVGTNDISFDPATGQNVIFRGNSTDGSGRIVLNCEDNSHGITIKGPPHSAAATYTLTLPNNDGDADQFLQTDGSGVLSFAAPTQKYTKFQFNLAAAPTGAVATSQIVGQEATLGSWSELTFANTATNGTGPSTGFDPTLTGITHSSGDFVGFEAGVYKVDVSLEVIIAGLANNSYNRYDHEIRPLSDTTQLPGVTQDFNFTCNATAPTGNTTQRVAMSLIVHLENATAANNKIQFHLNSDQSNNYYCNSALATFTKIG